MPGDQPDPRDVVLAELRTAYPDSSLDAATGEVLLPATDGRARVSLESVLSELRRTDPGAWREIARRWVNEIGVALRAPAAEIAAADLRLRVMPRWDPAAAEGVAHQPVPLAFDAVLVARTDGQRANYVTPAQAAPFGQPMEAISLALRQTITEEIFDVDVRDHQLAGESMRLIAKDESDFVTTALLSMDRFVVGPAPYGALVITPSYSAIGLHTVTGPDSLGMIGNLSQLATHLHGQDQRPCSTAVHWWYDRVFHVVEVTAGEDGRPAIHIPDALQELVDRLSPR